jgi:arsenite methyltransferase
MESVRCYFLSKNPNQFGMSMMILSTEDRKRIKEGLRRKYVRVAVSPNGNFQYPVGKAGLKEQNYDSQILKELPQDVLDSYCGVGNPFSLGEVNPGESVLDVGCGAGADTLIAAMMAGPDGSAVGIDMIAEMLERARENMGRAGLHNVTFQEASAEAIPFADDSFDVVISNGVFNLVPDKVKALREVFRVLKPSGRFQIADQVLTLKQSDDIASRIDNWAG